jgi:hypothetical protein
MPIISSPAYAGNVALVQEHFTVVPSCSISQMQGNGATAEAPFAIDFSDRLLSIDISFSMDNPTGAATIKLALGRGIDNISPLISTSRRLGSRAAIAPHNAISVTFWINDAYPYGVFDGRIDNVNVADAYGVISLTCRDLGGYLLNTDIRETTMYGTGGASAEIVMGQMMDDNGWSRDLLDTPVGSDFILYPYPVGETKLFEAMRTIAQQIGWDVRWFPAGWNNRPLGYFAHFYDPGRSRVLPDATIGPRRYNQIQELSWGDQDVRNDWVLHWQDPTTGLPQGPITAEDIASIEQYGRRKARIYLQRAENIRSNESASAFLAAALADSKDPFASHKIRGPLYPNVTLNDLHTYQANGVEYDTDLTLAVVGYQHHWDNKVGSQPYTIIAARGKPIAAYRDYRRSTPPKNLATTALPTTEYAPEGTWVMVTDSIAPPA